MRQSNIYILLYSAAITVVCGGLLAFASTSLKEKQDANIAMEQKKNILSSVLTLNEGENIDEIYAKQVKGFVIDYDGNVKEGKKPEDLKPRITGADFEWSSGKKLVSYEILPNEVKNGPNLLVSAQLVLQNQKGIESKTNASYIVGTSPVITVIRDEP